MTITAMTIAAGHVHGLPARPVPPLHPFDACLAAPYTGAVPPLHPHHPPTIGSYATPVSRRRGYAVSDP
jgi:hypothetical protein